MFDTPTELSKSFAGDLTAFAKEFEIAIEVLESHYLDRTSVHGEKMRARIKILQELRDPWRNPKDFAKHPTQNEIFTALQGVVRHVFFCEGERPEESSKVAVDLYLALQRLRRESGSSWLACSIFDMEAKLLHEIRTAHALTEPIRVSL